MHISFSQFITETQIIAEFQAKSNTKSKVKEADAGFNIISEPANFFSKQRTLVFTGTEYPLLFFMQLKNILSINFNNRVNFSTNIETIDIKQEDFFSLKNRLSTTFLGASQTYFFTEIDTDTGEKSGNIAAKNKDLYRYIETYKGPHTLILYVPQDKSINDEHISVISLPVRIDSLLFSQLLTWYSIILSSSVKKSIELLFKHVEFLSLEQACMLTNYVRLGLQDRSFFSDWLPALIVCEQSLFSLSQSFFQKDSKLFFSQWRRLSDAYSEQFWFVFWSEQIWRAAQVVDLNSQRNYVGARKIAFRLPFSFVNQDWRNYKKEELIAAHDFLCTLDHRFKTSGTVVGFDFFYSQFLSGQFA